jgi:hypothetical protein
VCFVLAAGLALRTLAWAPYTHHAEGWMGVAEDIAAGTSKGATLGAVVLGGGHVLGLTDVGTVALSQVPAQAWFELNVMAAWGTPFAYSMHQDMMRQPSTPSTLPAGSFSISDWRGYPQGAPQPEGPFRLLEGAKYQAARNAANAANNTLHQAKPALDGLHIHEIQPVKFAGSPTDIANKIPLSPPEHQQFTNWWNALQRSLTRE